MPQIRLRKPKAILFDVNGTASNTSFCDRYLGSYVRKSVRVFLANNWDHVQIQRDISMIRAVAQNNSSLPQITPDGEVPEVIQESVEHFVNYCFDNDIDFGALAQLRFHMWFDGYQKGVLVTPIYSDVAIQMKRWRCDYDIKLYVVSHGWTEANKVFMSRTNQGDMSLLIDGYFDTSVGNLAESGTYRKVLQEIGQQAGNVVLFTKNGSIARSAASVGILPILVMTHKKCYDALNEEEKKMLIVSTMNEVEFEDEK